MEGVVRAEPATATLDLEACGHVGGHHAKRLAIGADAKGVLRFQENEVGGDHVVLLVTERVSNDYLSHLQAADVSYLFCGEKEVNLHVALRKLASAFKLRKLMLQGGGKFNGAMLKAGLVDEISHITVPVADGGVGVSTFFDKHGPDRKVLVHRNLAQFNKEAIPGEICFFCFLVLVGWPLIRVFRFVYGCWTDKGSVA